MIRKARGLEPGSTAVEPSPAEPSAQRPWAIQLPVVGWAGPRRHRHRRQRRRFRVEGADVGAGHGHHRPRLVRDDDQEEARREHLPTFELLEADGDRLPAPGTIGRCLASRTGGPLSREVEHGVGSFDADGGPGRCPKARGMVVETRDVVRPARSPADSGKGGRREHLPERLATRPPCLPMNTARSPASLQRSRGFPVKGRSRGPGKLGAGGCRARFRTIPTRLSQLVPTLRRLSLVKT
jgi:hypothetical protein